MNEGVEGAAAGESVMYELEVVARGEAERKFHSECLALMFDDDGFEAVPLSSRTQKIASRSFRQLARASSRIWKELDDISNYPLKMFRSLTQLGLRFEIKAELDACPKRGDCWSRDTHGNATSLSFHVCLVGVSRRLWQAYMWHLS